MNAYEICIWKSVKHNGKFSHNIERRQLVHTRNEKEAGLKVELEPSKIHDMTKAGGILIEVSQEYIYEVVKIGTVHIEKFYVYSDGRNPIPVKH